MKISATLLVLGLSALAQAHTIAQRLKVAGTDMGQLKGMRSPKDNNPIQNVADSGMACNQNKLITPVDPSIISVQAGQQVGVWWQHVIGGPQGANDADNPIAKSHHGPIIYYLAKVSNSSTASSDGQSWFKVAQDGFDNTKLIWGVDNMVSNAGWSYFTMPSCVAPGNYLLRAEIIALHSAYAAGGAQFYIACGQINVSGSGTKTGTTMSFPGAYAANDPSIVINIYGPSGGPDNGGKVYTPPGGAVLTC